MWDTQRWSIRSPPQVASMLNLSFDWWPSLHFKWSGKTFHFAALLSDWLSILVPTQFPESVETRQWFSHSLQPCGPLPVFLWEPRLLFLCCKPSSGESHCPLVSYVPCHVILLCEEPHATSPCGRIWFMWRKPDMSINSSLTPSGDNSYSFIRVCYLLPFIFVFCFHTFRIHFWTGFFSALA